MAGNVNSGRKRKDLRLHMLDGTFRKDRHGSRAWPNLTPPGQKRDRYPFGAALFFISGRKALPGRGLAAAAHSLLGKVAKWSSPIDADGCVKACIIWIPAGVLEPLRAAVTRGPSCPGQKDVG
jgi:hypothetical protein